VQGLSLLLQGFAFVKETKAGFVDFAKGADDAEWTIRAESDGIQRVFPWVVGV